MTWLIIAIILATSQTTIAAEDTKDQIPVWPTDASRLMTSSFAEYRDNHFHSGIDLKTWGQTGYRVFAVADGWVSRIRVSPFGYGRALYITLNDGRVVVYGHLEEFANPISDYVWNAQKNYGQYSVQLYPAKGEFPVKAGQLVAYTGESGVGPPHLHFEIRTPDEEPINPLSQGFTIEDNIRPTIREIAISPLNHYSRVNKSPLPYFIDIHAVNGEAILPDPIPITGSIGFSFRAFDRADGAGNAFNIYRATLEIDDSLCYQTTYDRFGYYETGQIRLEREWRFNVSGDGHFTRLYRHPKNTLDFSPKEATGIINSRRYSSSPVTFRIIVEDYYGNSTTVRGEIYAPELGPTPMYLDVVDITISPEDSSTLINLTPMFFDNYLAVSVPSEFNLNKKPNGWIYTDRKMSLLLMSNEKSDWFGSAPLDFEYSGPIELCVFNESTAGEKRIGHSTWTQWAIRPRHPQTVSFPDAKCSVSFPRNSLWQPICPRIDSTQYPVNGINYLSQAWQLNPQEIPLAGNIQIQWQIPENEIATKQIAIYRWSRRDFWKILTPFTCVDDTLIQAPSDELGIFALIRDDVAPQLEPVYPLDDAVVSTTTPNLVVQIGDILSGFEEEGIKMFLDGEQVISEYDPDARKVKYKVRDPLAIGEHYLTTEVKDRAGNLTIKRITFRITGGNR